MSIEQKLYDRSESKCELCNTETNLSVYEVPPNSDGSIEQCALLCNTCLDQINDPEKMIANHWRCLNDSMWNQNPAIQVLAWRMLTRLRAEGWPQDLLDMLYLDEETASWAAATGEGEEKGKEAEYRDCNGTLLTAGDTVTVIKDLVVKGAGFTAKRGTAVRNISLDPDDNNNIEGRVNSQQIVILTKFVKKSK